MPRRAKGARLYFERACYDRAGRLLRKEFMSSGMVSSSEALASAKAKLKKLKASSPTT